MSTGRPEQSGHRVRPASLDDLSRGAELHPSPELQRIGPVRSVAGAAGAAAATAATTAAKPTLATEPAATAAPEPTTPAEPVTASRPPVAKAARLEPDTDDAARLDTQPHPVVVITRQGKLELVDERRPVVPDGHLEPAGERKRQTTSWAFARPNQFDLPQPVEGPPHPTAG